MLSAGLAVIDPVCVSVSVVVVRYGATRAWPRTTWPLHRRQSLYLHCCSLHPGCLRYSTVQAADHSSIVYASITRGNRFKLVPQHCKYDLQKHYFTNRVVPIWNSLPNDVVMADNINSFKNHLDKFWSSCEFVYSYRTQLFWTGSVK